MLVLLRVSVCLGDHRCLWLKKFQGSFGAAGFGALAGSWSLVPSGRGTYRWRNPHYLHLWLCYGFHPISKKRRLVSGALAAPVVTPGSPMSLSTFSTCGNSMSNKSTRWILKNGFHRLSSQALLFALTAAVHSFQHHAIFASTQRRSIGPKHLQQHLGHAVQFGSCQQLR